MWYVEKQLGFKRLTDIKDSSCVTGNSLCGFNSATRIFSRNIFKLSPMIHCRLFVPHRLYQIRKAILVEDENYRSISANTLLKMGKKTLKKVVADALKIR